jgi:hypothetical protein
MAFCANCGAQMADGDKFCGNCGTTLAAENSAPQQNFQQNVQPNVQPNVQQNFQQNVQPNFQNQQAPNFGPGPGQQQYAPQGPSNFTIAMEELGKEVSAFFKNPVAAISKVKFQMSSMATYLFAGLMTLILILLNFWSAAQNLALVGATSLSTNSAITTIEDAFSSVFGGNEKETLFDIGYGKIFLASFFGKIFLASFFFVIVMLAALWGLSLLVNSVMLKGQFNAVQALNVVVFAAIPYALLSIVSIIFGYVEANLSYLIYLAGIMASIILLYKAISSNINKAESSALYSFLVIPVALYFVNFLFFKVAGAEVAMFYNGIFMGIN